MQDNSPIIFYHYFDLANPDVFCSELKRRFKESGHTRPIEFREWNCYNELPGRDGDLFCFDCVVLSALIDKGYLREIPDIIDTSNVYSWFTDTTRIGTKLYGIPLMGCFDAVICRKKDYKPFNNVFEIKGKLSTHLKSQVLYFYLMTLFNTGGNQEKAMDTLWKLKKMMYDENEYYKSSFSNEEVYERFINGEVEYFIGFFENLRRFPKDEYIVQRANFSESEQEDFPFILVDMVSMGTNPKGEKLLDCIDVMEIVSSDDFIYSICQENGKPLYMTPIDKIALHRLRKLDPIYDSIIKIMEDDYNCCMRFGSDFYETIDAREEALRKIIESEKE